MSEQEQIKKPADSPAPKDKVPSPQGSGSYTSKSYDELLQGFAEIKKIQTNQEVFEKRRNEVSFEIVKKAIDEKENPDV